MRQCASICTCQGSFLAHVIVWLIYLVLCVNKPLVTMARTINILSTVPFNLCINPNPSAGYCRRELVTNMQQVASLQNELEDVTIPLEVVE